MPSFLDVAREAAARAGDCQVLVTGEAAGTASFSELLGDPGTAPQVAFDPSADIAALPYSSGTTGMSKGVMLSHRNLIANALQCEAPLALSADDVLIAVSTSGSGIAGSSVTGTGVYALSDRGIGVHAVGGGATAADPPPCQQRRSWLRVVPTPASAV